MPAGLSVKKIEKIQAEASREGIRAIASYLQEHLGQKITAYLAGLDDAKGVGLWVAGKARPRLEAATRLRNAYQAARMIVDCYGDETARAWFFGTNTRLDDQAPAFVLRHSKSPEEMSPVVPVARAFAAAAD